MLGAVTFLEEKQQIIYKYLDSTTVLRSQYQNSDNKWRLTQFHKIPRYYLWKEWLLIATPRECSHDVKDIVKGQSDQAVPE